jgi:kynurenine formamidase
MSSSTIFLSFPISESTPAYGNGSRAKIDAVNRITNGDSCNTSEWRIPNHIGTHIDAPHHFDANGLRIDDYPAAFWLCQSIGVVDVSPIDPGELVSFDRMDATTGRVAQDIEILLIKTNFTKHRNESLYWQKNPGLEPGLADELRSKFPRLKMVGLDSISLSSFANREVGRKAHHAFLSDERPILVIEDMDLSKISQGSEIISLTIAPLIVEGADGAPCTIIAEVI